MAITRCDRPRPCPHPVLWLVAALLAVLVAAAPARGETLRVGIASLPPSYGNPFMANGLPGTLTWHQLFDGLTALDENGRVAPGLAVSWSLEQPTRWRFTLRPDAVFSNGRPFTAEAAKATFDWLNSEAGRGTVVANELRGIARVSVVGPHELVIETTRPDPILPNRLAAIMIVEPQAWRELGPHGFARRPVGTGPYRVERWQNANGAAVLVANPHAWDPPAIGRVEIYPLSDHASRLQAAVSGQLHVAGSMRPEHIATFERRGFSAMVDPIKQVLSIAFDLTGHPDSPMQDRRVRQALNHAVDRQAIAELITYATTRPASQGAAPGTFGHNPNIEPYAYAPDRARALLAEAGYADGFAFTATVVIGSYANDLEIYQKIQQDLAAVGVEVTFDGTIFANWIRHYLFGTWDSEAFGLSWNSTPYNDALRPMEYFSCKKANPFFCDQTMMPDIQAAATELDRTRRERLLQDLQSAFHDAAPCLFLLELGGVWVFSDQLSGFTMRSRVPQLADISFR